MSDAFVPFVTGVITGAPVWVWGVLALLTFFGWRATKEREVSANRYAILPMWGILSVTTVAQSDPTALVWAAFIVAYAVGTIFGWTVQGRVIIRAGNGRALLAGEWLTMSLLMTMFWLRFINGAAEAIAPDLAASAPMVTTITFIGGASAGVFMGRSVRTVRVVYQAPSIPR